MFSTTLNSKTAKNIEILWNFEEMRLQKLKIAKKLVVDLKNYRLTSAHFQKLIFLILWILLYPVNKKLDRPNEPEKVKNTKMSQVVKRQKIQIRRRDVKFFFLG